jgi:N-acetylmuramoyl-L-alanine amidase
MEADRRAGKLQDSSETACVSSLLRHNMQMLVLAKGAGLLLLVLALGGCASKPLDLQSLNWARDQGKPSFTGVPGSTNATLAPTVSVPPALPPAPRYDTGSDLDTFPQTWISLRSWCKSKGLDTPATVTLRRSPAFAIRTDLGTFVFQPGSQLAEWNGIQVHLGFAPQQINDEPYLHSVDLRKTMQPLLLTVPQQLPRPSPVIVIDPGHGGEDSGAVSVLGQGLEKDYALDWARRLQALLVANGCKALLTHTSDRDMPLTNRIAFADEQQADYFISLHFNSTGSGNSLAGLETYCLTPPGLPSTLTRGYGDDPTQGFLNNAWDVENLLLATRVHRNLVAAAGMPDRGVRRARFMGVLRGQQRPAILVEGGYLSSAAEAKKIADPMYRQKLAEGIAQGLLGRQLLAGSGTSSSPGSPPLSR